LLICLTAIVSFAASGAAAELEISVSKHREIVNPSNEKEKNVLLCFSIPDTLNTADIHYAELRVKPSFTKTHRSHVNVMVYPLSEDISIENATWSSILGDPDETLNIDYGMHKLLRSSDTEPIRIDITFWLVKCARGKLSNYGLLLKSELSEDEGLTLSADDAFPSGAVGVVRVYFTGRSCTSPALDSAN
jgi:hypothetical protein